MILQEYKILKPLFQVGKGSRTDLNGNKPPLQVSDTLGVSKNTIQKLCNISKYAEHVYGSTKNKRYTDMMKKLDKGELIISKLEKKLKTQFELSQSTIDIQPGDYKKPNFTIFNKNSKHLVDLKDGSIQVILTSPPYFQVKDYEIGKDQLGKENSPYEFTKRLAEHFDECFRVLKSNGSLFVNLGDYIVDGQYKLVPTHFGLEMAKRGWLINDVITWAKNNPRPSQAKRTINCTEQIIHFVKSKHFYFNLDWIEEFNKKPENDGFKDLFHGLGGENNKLRSFLDFRGENIIRSNGANTSKLREKCKELGLNTIHDSTFPEIIPEVFIRSTSKEGDTILDIFNGTACTGVVANVLNRNYVGYELNPEYIFQSKVRLEFLKEDTKLNLLKSA